MSFAIHGLQPPNALHALGPVDLSAVFRPIRGRTHRQEITGLAALAPNFFCRAYDKDAVLRSLRVQNVGESLVIEWPVTFPTCELQETTSLEGTPVWIRSSVTVQRTGGIFRTVLQPGSTNRFYRLRCPQ